MSQLPTGAPPVAPVEPQPGSAEYNMQTAMSAPNTIPAKFRNADGTVNQELLLQSYKALEQYQRGTAPNPTAVVAPDAAAVLDANAAVPASAPTPGTVDDILSQEKPAAPTVNWDAVRSGNVTEQDAANLKAMGVPDDIIKQYASGVAERKAAAIKDVAAAVGGQENLKATLLWAQKTLPAAEWNSLREAVSKGGQAKTLLMGLHAQYQATKPAESGVITPADGGVGGGTPSVTPYASKAEMFADMDERDSAGKAKYSYDPAKQKAVALRIFVTNGGDPRNFEQLYKPSSDY